MPPTMGRPLVVSSTVLRSLGVLVLLLHKKNVDLPSKKSTTAITVVASAAAE